MTRGTASPSHDQEHPTTGVPVVRPTFAQPSSGGFTSTPRFARILVILLGIHHPPTADDNVELDDFRWIMGVAAMAIPVLCFPLQAIKQ